MKASDLVAAAGWLRPRVSWLTHPAVWLAFVWLWLAAVQPEFFTWESFRLMLVHSGPTVLLAAGLTLVLLAGRVDVSLGALAGLAAGVGGCLAAAGVSAPVTVAVLLAAGLGGGVLQAFLLWRLRVPAVVLTLLLLFFWDGLAAEVSRPLPAFAEAAAPIAGSPGFSLALGLAVLLLSQGLLQTTVFGVRLRALGAEPELARLASLPVQPLLFGVYAAAGACAALAACSTPEPPAATTSWPGWPAQGLAALAAAVLGGTRLTGGRATFWPGTLIGVLLVRSVETSLQLAQAPPGAHATALGALLAAALVLDRLREKVPHPPPPDT